MLGLRPFYCDKNGKPFEDRGCFAAGTLVHTKTGLVPIENLKVGDWVLAQPEMGGELTYKRVAKTFVFEDKEVYLLRYANADKVEQIVAGGNHPFWVKGKAWTALSEIDWDCKLILQDGTEVGVFCVQKIHKTNESNVGWVSSIYGIDPMDFSGDLVDLSGAEIVFGKEGVFNSSTLDSEPQAYLRRTVYNLEVEDFHTYYVGKCGVWVHNQNYKTENTTLGRDAALERVFDHVELKETCFSGDTYVHIKFVLA